jgi:hypothetical protein
MFSLNFFIFLLLSLSSAPKLIQGQLLTAFQSTSKLPTPRILTSIIYDGQDSIHIVGGFDHFGPSGNFMTYNINSDRILVQDTGSALFGGNLAIDSQKNIYYLGGLLDGGYDKAVLLYDQEFASWSRVADLPFEKVFSSVIHPKNEGGGELVYLIGGEFDAGVVTFNTTNWSTSFYDDIQEIGQG